MSEKDSPKLRIALVAPGFRRDQHDWCIPWLQNFVQRMSELCDLTVYALRYPHAVQTYSASGAMVHSLGWGQQAGLRRWLLYREFQRLFETHHHSNAYQLVHGLWAEETGYLAARAAKRLSIPAIVSLVGGELVGFRDIGYGSLLGMQTRTLVRHSLRAADRIIAPSDTMSALACHSLPGICTRMSKIPLGVNLQLFPDGPSDGCDWNTAERHILHVSNLSPVKDPHLLLQTFQIIRARLPNSRLHVVGGQAMPSWWQQRLERLGLNIAVSFHGCRPHNEMAPYYQSADVTLMTSRHEGHMNVALEALACGCPLVSTAVGVVPELSPPARSVNSRDPQALAFSVLELLQDPQEREKIRRTGRQKVCKDYSLETMVERYLEEYCRLTVPSNPKRIQNHK